MGDPRDWRDGAPSDLPPELDPRRGRGSRPLPPPGSRGVARSTLPPRGPVPQRPRGSQVLPPRPPQQRRSRGRRAVRVLSWISVVTSVTVLMAATAGYALMIRYDRNIPRITGILDHAQRPPQAPKDAINVLIVGSDSRGDAKAGEEFQGRGDDFVTGQRSDTVILAHFFGGTHKVQLVSFPRDSWVEIPAYTDEEGRTRRARMAKLNRAFSDGGPPLLVRTIEGLTDVRIDHYVQINFQAFQRMVDEVGGVEVCLTKPARDKFSRIDLDAGRHHVNGRVALAFVRQRHGLANGDIDRIKRQQQFIGALVRRVLSAPTLLRPDRITGFLDAATDGVQVDDGTRMKDIVNLAGRFRSFQAGGVIFSTVPIADQGAKRGGGQDVVLLDDDKAAELFADIAADRPPDVPKPQATKGAPLTVPPSAVRVKVFNGAGVNGLGRKTADDLTEVGFTVVGIPENRGTGASQTVVFHGPDRADSARTLAAAVPGATTQLDPTLGRTLEIVVGSSYSGAKKVTVTAPRTTPTATAAPKVVTAAENPCAP